MSALVPLAGVCLSREASIDHVHALVKAGVLEQPELAPDGLEMVPSEYLDEIDGDPMPELPEGEWRRHCAREFRRFRDGRKRLLTAIGPDRAHQREQQLCRIASAAWGVGLALLMEGERPAASIWLSRAATLYRRSLADAEAGSWGRSIGAIKSRLLADDGRAAEREAICTLQLRAATASTIGRYAACLALLVLARNQDASAVARDLGQREEFPPATASALRALAARDRLAYVTSVGDVLRTFETRTRFLEDIPVADTVLVLQSLAAARGLVCDLTSNRLPTSS